MLRPRTSRSAPTRRSGKAALVALLVTVCALAVLFLRGRGSETPEPAPARVMTLEERYREDPRIGPLVDPCAWGAPFEMDTTDLPRILTTKLDVQAQREPMRRWSDALSAMGDEAEEALTELFEDALRDRMRTAVAKNVLAVCANSTSDFGVELAKTGLSSQYEQIRRESVIVLMRHPRPENFDLVLSAFPGLQGTGTMGHALEALVRADPVRYAEQIGVWLEEERPEPGFEGGSLLLDAAVSRAWHIDDPEAAARLYTIAGAHMWLKPRMRLPLIGPAAAHGNESALQELRDTLASPKQGLRARAAEALARGGLGHELYVLAATTENAVERAEAWKLILDPEYTPEQTPEEEEELVRWASQALADDSSRVREAVLKPLLERGDEDARAVLLSMLGEGPVQRSEAASYMRDTFAGDQEFAERVRTLLSSIWDRELAGSATVAELRSVLTALGAVPGERSGRMLLEYAREIHRRNQERLSPDREAPLTPRLAIGQIFNAGPEARDVILEALGSETDPFLRLDLIDLAWQDFEDDSFEVLAGLLEDETQSSYERVYVADRLLRMKMPAKLLPILKRVYRSSSDGVMRNGIGCLLWIWFGPPMTR